MAATEKLVPDFATKPEAMLYHAVGLPSGQGVTLTFATRALLTRYRDRLYGARNRARGDAKRIYPEHDALWGLSPWEDIQCLTTNADPPSLWIGVPSAEMLGIVDCEESHEPSS